VTTPLDNAPGGQVTIADLFRVMSGIQLDLRSALTKLEVIDTRNVGADAAQVDHEQRLRALESSKNKMAGAVAFASLLAGGVAGWLASIPHR
jgi:hypothetical protein